MLLGRIGSVRAGMPDLRLEPLARVFHQGPLSVRQYQCPFVDTPSAYLELLCS